jgi:hypothetical protein
MADHRHQSRNSTDDVFDDEYAVDDHYDGVADGFAPGRVQPASDRWSIRSEDPSIRSVHAHMSDAPRFSTGSTRNSMHKPRPDHFYYPVRSWNRPQTQYCLVSKGFCPYCKPCSWHHRPQPPLLNVSSRYKRSSQPLHLYYHIYHSCCSIYRRPKPRPYTPLQYVSSECL